jgi:hypothetical protein
MSIIMRIIQQFDPAEEAAFMELEKQFDALEKSRPDYPKGKRIQPISATEPVNTLIWENEFPDIASAYATLDFFKGDEHHENLFSKQAGFIRSVKIEFYKNLDF